MFKQSSFTAHCVKRGFTLPQRVNVLMPSIVPRGNNQRQHVFTGQFYEGLLFLHSPHLEPLPLLPLLHHDTRSGAGGRVSILVVNSNA